MMIETIEFWHWLVIGLCFLALEVFAPGAILMWFGFGGLVTGLLLWLIPSMNLEAQVLIFALFFVFFKYKAGLTKGVIISIDRRDFYYNINLDILYIIEEGEIIITI